MNLKEHAGKLEIAMLAVAVAAATVSAIFSKLSIISSFSTHHPPVFSPRPC
jgi:hypothetical protein